jgi:hypothetical protein
MPEIGAGVDDRDADACAAGDRPRLGRVDVGVGRAAAAPDALAGVVQAPQQAGHRVGGRAAAAIGLGPQDVRVLAQLRQRSGAITGPRPDDLDAGDRQRLGQRDGGVRAHFNALGGGQAGAPLEHDPVGGLGRGGEDDGSEQSADAQRDETGHRT